MSLYKQECTHNNGMSSDLFAVNNNFCTGIYQQPIDVFNVIPTEDGTYFICAAQSVFANQPLTLYQANVVSYCGYECIVMDCARSIILETNFFANDFGVNGNVTFTGLSPSGKLIVNTVAFESTQTFLYSTKIFKALISVVVDVDLAPLCAVLNSTSIGLPFYLPRVTSILSVTYAGENLLFSNGYSDVVAGENWRLSAPSATSGDADGYIDLSAVLEADGLLTVTYFVNGVSADLQAQLQSGSPAQKSSAQTIIYANEAQNPVVNVPYLIGFDEVGVQYPADIKAYNALPTS